LKRPTTIWACTFGPLSLQGNVACEGEHLDLLVDAEVPILPFRDVEVAEDAGTQRADSGEVRGGNLLISREVGETTNHLFPAAEDNRKPSLAFNFLKPFDMHGVSSLYLHRGATEMPEPRQNPVTATGKKRVVASRGDLVWMRCQT